MVGKSKIIAQHPKYTLVVSMKIIFRRNILNVFSICVIVILTIKHQIQDMCIKPWLIPSIDCIYRNVFILKTEL